MGRYFLVLGISAILLSSCAAFEPTSSKPVLKLNPVSFSEIEGWQGDRQSESLAAFSKSCARMMKMPANKDLGVVGTARDWQAVCGQIPSVVTDESVRQFYEMNFTPYLASDKGAADGLFTGYYEASLNGSLVRGGKYQTPLRARPSDLVMVNLGDFRPELKGQRIAGRVNSVGQLKPYEDRTAIETGTLPKDMDKALFWVDSAVDAFFLQIQGSGVVTLSDGTTQRIGYDGQNGHPYTAIGKELIARGALTKDNVSMQTIREWLAAHPDDAVDVMRRNKSYVFFKKLDTDAPVGGEGVPLTSERSMAVDHSVWPYGLPMFVSAAPPEEGAGPIKRLMIAQDTGGAIIGVVRGDIFWGYGARAAHNAGVMKSRGQLWVLLPKSVIPKSVK